MQSRRRATAYVATFEPYDGRGLGHTSLYVEGEDGTTFQRSVFPSGHYGAAYFHNICLGFIPVPAFITKGLDRDVKYEAAPPVAIHRIDNLDLDAMLNENDIFKHNVEKGYHAFSLRYNGNFNVFNYFYKGMMSIKNYYENDNKQEGRVKTENLNNKIIVSNNPAPSLGNCTDAVIRSLKAGGFNHQQSPHNQFFSFFLATGHTPSRFKQDLTESGAVDVTHSELLPDTIKTAVSTGQEIFKQRDFSAEEALRENQASMRKRMESYF